MVIFHSLPEGLQMFTAHGSEQLRALQPRAALRDRTQASVARRVAVKGTISLRNGEVF